MNIVINHVHYLTPSGPNVVIILRFYCGLQLKLFDCARPHKIDSQAPRWTTSLALSRKVQKKVIKEESIAAGAVKPKLTKTSPASTIIP